MNALDLQALSPLIVLFVGAVALLILATVPSLRDRQWAGALAVFGLALAAIPCALRAAPRDVTPLLVIDRPALLYTGLILLAAMGVTALSAGYWRRRSGEFYVLLTLATAGSLALASARHMAGLFLGLEILSVALYGLIAYARGPRGVEAGLKYLVLAAASAAFLLFGMALLYAEAGTLDLAALFAPVQRGTLFHAGLMLFLVGAGFKLAVAPFHLWTPDVVEGAPAPVSAFVATVSKGAMVAVLLRFVAPMGWGGAPPFFATLALMAAASMFIGNWLALLQTDLKRLLAYSSIAHVGYVLIAVLAGGPRAFGAATVYMAAYFLANLAAFGVVARLSDGDHEPTDIKDYAGLAWRRPWLAVAMTAALLSLTGIPLTAGFIAKFGVAAAGVSVGMWKLVLILAINSALSAYYYLRVIAALFQDEDGVTETDRRPLGAAALALALAGLVWLGVYPAPALKFLDAFGPQKIVYSPSEGTPNP